MTDHPLVTDYLRRLGQAAAHAPADGRDLLLDEVANHLRATVPLNATDERARQLLMEFGSPEDLVAEAFGAAPAPATTTGAGLAEEVGPATGRGATGRRRRLWWTGVAAVVVAVTALVVSLVVPETEDEGGGRGGQRGGPTGGDPAGAGATHHRGARLRGVRPRLEDLPALPPVRSTPTVSPHVQSRRSLSSSRRGVAR